MLHRQNNTTLVPDLTGSDTDFVGTLRMSPYPRNRFILLRFAEIDSLKRLIYSFIVKNTTVWRTSCLPCLASTFFLDKPHGNQIEEDSLVGMNSDQRYYMRGVSNNTCLEC